jgi:glycosyltransferase involved in cell wall biosynthesis
MIGSGPLEQSLRALARELCIDEKIFWLGERDARQYFAAFDLFAMTSRKEGLPYVVLEAMAAGLPVVATDTSGVEILVDHGINGFVLPLGDVQGFADALRRIISDPACRQRFGDASRQKCKLFSVDRMVTQTLATYQSAINERIDLEDAALATTEGELS